MIRIVASAVTALLLVATWPQLLGLQRAQLIAQLVALRGLLVLLAAIGIVLSLITTWRSSSNKSLTNVLVVALLVVVVGNVAVMVSRGVSVVEPAATSSVDGQVRVLAWNTLGNSPGAELIADFALEHGIDVLALPETTHNSAQEIAEAMQAGGQTMQVFVLATDPSLSTRSTALLVNRALGEYTLDETLGSTPRLPSVVARPLVGDGPTLIAAHPVPPLLGYLDAWEPGLEWLAERCRATNVIIAGDFNATLDHFAGLAEPEADLGACRSGAKVTRQGALGTWPSQLPLLLAAPIDHVLATDDWAFADFRVATELDGSGSDHRALFATLTRIR